jgi:hypothetical protein
MTVARAIAKVKQRLGLVDDDVANPLLDAEILGRLNAAQDDLAVTHTYLRQARVVEKAVAGGQRFVDLPADCLLGQPDHVEWSDGTTRTVLTAGIDRREQPTPTGWPQKYQMTATTGLIGVTVDNGGSGYADDDAVVVSGGTRATYGHDPVLTLVTDGGAIESVTIEDCGAGWSGVPTLTPGGGSSAVLTAELGPVQVMELWPDPGAGTIRIEYRSAVSDLEEETDTLALDPVAVIGRAAWAMCNDKDKAQKLLAEHTAYLESFKASQQPGRTFSLSAWRRDGWE